MGNHDYGRLLMKYALLIYSPSTAEEYGANLDRARKSADPERGPWVDYTRAARDAGVLVAAEQLTHSETATSVRANGEDGLVTDGPFMETKEHLLGFYLIDVPDLDAALDWAARMPAVNRGTVEVRAAISGMAWQQVLD
jgi:hypothetical protein